MPSKLSELRKRIYLNLKEKAYGLEGEVTPELKTYRKDQVESSKRPFSSSNIDELKASVSASDIIYLGDFHTFDQNIRNVLRVLKVIASGDKNCAIGLEMVHARHQVCLDAYMGNQLTELEFLESIHYHNSWRFPWTHYKLIFELAKKHDIQMIALNTDGGLRDRDAYAANILVENLNLAPAAQIVVVYGELHISRDKIPALVENKMPDVKQTIIHQNLDEVYWKLKNDDEESEKIIKFDSNEFCINSAPPWVKYESMIYWYENLDDDPDFDIHEYIIENGKKIFSDDTFENFFTISSQLAKTLRLNIDEDELESFNLRDHTGLEFIEEKIQSLGSAPLAKFYNDLIAKGQSFRLAGEDTFYCSSYSMNRISYLAGVHIFYNWLKTNRAFEDSKLEAEDKESIFYRSLLECMHAFFFSKIMNPHRKCDMYYDLRQSLDANDPARAASVLALDGGAASEFLKRLSLTESHTAAEICGHIFGEYLYIKTFDQEGIKTFSEDFMDLSFDADSFQRTREKLLKGVDYKEHKKRYF